MVKVRPFQIAISLIKRNRGSIQLIICKRIKKVNLQETEKISVTDLHAVDGEKRGGGVRNGLSNLHPPCNKPSPEACTVKGKPRINGK